MSAITSLFDGPPFRSGDLHLGHALVSFIKDIIMRHNDIKHLDKQGNDCHGLPIEMMVQKMHPGITDNNDFILKCIEVIKSFSNSWDDTFNKLGRYCNKDDAYFTMDTDYMESGWWAFKTLMDKGLVYFSHQIAPYSYGCKTVISNFEATSNYKRVSVDTVYPKFKLANYDNVYIIAWTTTVWTLPCNLALIVNADYNYNLVYDSADDCYYIVGEFCNIFSLDPKFTVMKTFRGEKLVGEKYIPLFNYYDDNNNPNLFRIVSDPYVLNTSGTGIVHAAPGFGEDDLRVCVNKNIIDMKNAASYCPIDEDGNFTDFISDYKQTLVFDIANKIYLDLKKNGKIYKKETIYHDYPHCWRTDTKIINKLAEGVYIKVTAIKDDIIRNNKKVNWFPTKCGNRFSEWIENARDWCVSRNRVFGTPIPIWQNDEGERICIGSIKELVDRANLKYIPDDLHLNTIGNITIPSHNGGSPLKLIQQVMDCWWDSGIAPFASQHYPFENKDVVDQKEFDTDLVVEGIDQTRGWFYTLLVMSTALFNRPAYKNVICTGLVLGHDNKKMSKRNGNYEPLHPIIEKYGSDALRIYMVSSVSSRGESFAFNERELSTVNKLIYQYMHIYSLFNYYFDKIAGREDFDFNAYLLTENIVDKWIMSRVSTLERDIHTIVSTFNFCKMLSTITKFIDDVSVWYINFVKDRMKGMMGDLEQSISLSVLYHVFVQSLVILKNIMPFTYDTVINKNNIIVDKIIFNEEPDIEESMVELQNVINSIRKLREQTIDCASRKKVLQSVKIFHTEIDKINLLNNLKDFLLNDTNCQNITFPNLEEHFDIKLKGNFKTLGPKFGKKIGDVNKYINNIKVTGDYRELIKKNFPNIDDEDYSVTFTYRGKVSPPLYYIDDIQSGYKILIDTTQTEESIKSFNTRLLFSAIQKMRKKAGLKISEHITIYYNSTQLNNDNKVNPHRVQDIISDNLQYFEQYINATFVDCESIGDHTVTDSFTVGDTLYTIGFF